MSSRDKAWKLGTELANMSADLQVIALVAMVTAAREWQNDEGAYGDMAAHQWQAIGNKVRGLPANEATDVKRLIRLIAATMEHDMTPGLNGQAGN